MPSARGVSNTTHRSGGTVVRFNGKADDVLNGESLDMLRAAANTVAGRVRLPRARPGRARLELGVRAGMGPRGAFSQVMMRGAGALAVEFGTRRSRAVAPLRRALGGGV